MTLGGAQLTTRISHTTNTSYLAAQRRLCLALVPRKDEALHQNLCSSTYPSLLSGKEYHNQSSLSTGSTN